MKFRINCILTLIFLFFGSSLERSIGNHGVSPIKFDNSPQKWTHRDLLLFANNGGFSGDLPPPKSSTVSPLSFITSQVGNMIEYAYNWSFGALYSFMEPAIYHIKKTPTITRLFMFASIIPTIASWLSYNGYFPSFLLFQGWRDLRETFHFWKPITTFSYFGSLGINYFLTMHFVHSYMSSLETSFSSKLAFLASLAFGAINLLTIYTLLPKLDKAYLGHNLVCYLVYLWSRAHEGEIVHLFSNDLLRIKAEWIPALFACQSLLASGLPLSTTSASSTLRSVLVSLLSSQALMIDVIGMSIGYIFLLLMGN